MPDADLTLAEMEQSLLKPAARRKPGYEVATVQLRSGAPVRGFLRNESLYDLQLQGFDGRLYLLRRDEVTAIEREAASYMPALKADRSRSARTCWRTWRSHAAESPARAAANDLPGAVPGTASPIRNPATGPLITAS